MVTALLIGCALVAVGYLFVYVLTMVVDDTAAGREDTEDEEALAWLNSLRDES